MDPKNGEILAMASYPRYDPNDFIASGNPEFNRQKNMNIARWFENETYLAAVWDHKKPLERELFDERQGLFTEEPLLLTWDNYLSFVLPKTSPVLKQLEKIGKLHQAILLQQKVERLLALSGQSDLYPLFNVLYKEDGHKPHPAQFSTEALDKIEENFKTHATEVNSLKQALAPFLDPIPENYDKVLLVDLLRVAVRGDHFSPALLSKVGSHSLSTYRNASASKTILTEHLKKMTKELFHNLDFKEWRKENEKAFLKEKRQIEKSKKQYAKPYIDYLDRQEDEMFQEFWIRHQWELILALLKGEQKPSNQPIKPYLEYFHRFRNELQEGLHAELTWRPAYESLCEILKGLTKVTTAAYLKSMRSFEELTRPLMGRYRHLRKKDGIQLEKHLAAAFYPVKGFGFGRSQAYRQAAPQGSIFKLVTAYAALSQLYQEIGEHKATFKTLNPLDIVDHTHRKGKETYIGYHEDGKAIPRAYRGGRLPRSTRVMGKLDLLKAIETSSNPYFSLLAGDFLKSPEDLARAARLFSYGNKTGIDLPSEISGKIPEDLSTNRTGLYATAIGQHSLVVTPMQTAIMLSSIANGGHILKPKIVNIAAGKRPMRRDASNKFPFQDLLASIGVDFPLFSNELDDEKLHVTHYPPIVQNSIPMPPIIRTILLEGMQRVVIKTQEESIASLSRLYRDHPEAIGDYLDLKEDFVGKTSTAEVMENLDLDLHKGTNLYTHVWFGGISFNKDGTTSQKIVLHDHFGEPELVVVVYLCYGAYGKEAAPVAAQIVKKWREIKAKYSS